ncbi:MAG: DUF192 domain-containing protein [Bryobacteraceae bacterium]|nr:DUF192 domain-containing protein [Bryobacteraceae bacterium]
MSKIRVRNATKGTVLAESAGVADTPETRNRGLLKHQSLPEGEGLWIIPTQGVHTFFMKFAIDVLYLNKARKVLKIRPDMGKSRLSFCLSAHSVLELPAGTAARTGTGVGDQLEFEKLA